jgi:hypothetical protein
MLKFIGTAPWGAAARTGCDVQQLVSLCGVPEVAMGSSVAVIRASFNRVAGDAETDQLFGIRLRAYSGDASSYDAAGWLAESNVVLLSDSDPGTWETLSTSLDIPADADYLAVWVHGTEDVFNDDVLPEFDGHYCDNVVLTIGPTGTAAPQVPASVLSLEQSRPNPFNPSTTIRFKLPSTEHVTLLIYDAKGRVVRTLLNEVRTSGEHNVEWDGRDSSGNRVVSGVYLYRVAAGGHMETRKAVLIK